MSAEWWGADVIPRMRWRGTIEEGAQIPEGWGIAYYDPSTVRAIIMPLPLNVIVGGWRAFIWWLKCPPWRLVEYKAERMRHLAIDKYNRGYEDAVLLFESRVRQYQHDVRLLSARNAALSEQLAKVNMLTPRVVQMNVTQEQMDEVKKWTR